MEKQSAQVSPSSSPEVSANDLLAWCREAREHCEAIDAATREYITPRQERLKELESKIQVAMDTLDMEKIPVKGFGTYFRKSNFSVKVPKSEVEREAFFGYLKERGIFENMVTVNSMTLNAWFKQEMEAAVEKGDVDFKIPGIEEPKAFFTLQFRKETKRG